VDNLEHYSGLNERELMVASLSGEQARLAESASDGSGEPRCPVERLCMRGFIAPQFF
jgi:hypothetical protein